MDEKCMNIGELRKALEGFGDECLVYVFAGTNENPGEVPVVSAGIGLDGSDLGLEGGPRRLTKEQRGVLLRVGELCCEVAWVPAAAKCDACEQEFPKRDMVETISLAGEKGFSCRECADEAGIT